MHCVAGANAEKTSVPPEAQVDRVPHDQGEKDSSVGGQDHVVEGVEETGGMEGCVQDKGKDIDGVGKELEEDPMASTGPLSTTVVKESTVCCPY